MAARQAQQLRKRVLPALRRVLYASAGLSVAGAAIVAWDVADRVGRRHEQVGVNPALN